VAAAPRAAGVEWAQWNWKGVRQFVQQRFGLWLSSRTCLNYLHRLGFVRKRPKKRLLKAKAEQREAFVATYVALRQDAQERGAKLFFVDEAHFRADVDLRSKWVLRGEPALVDTSSPRFGEKASYYSAVCLETGEVEAMPVKGNTNAQTSVTFLQQLRAHHPGRLIVLWDNAPAHRGPEIRAYLTTPDLNLRLVALPGYSPDFNPDEAIWEWIREDVTANTCFGKAANVREKVNEFFAALPERTEEVKQRCRRTLQALADAFVADARLVTDEINHTFSPCV
jgi:transposase